MKCFQCSKEIQGSGLLLGIDGDFVCDSKCRDDYEKQKEHFLNNIVDSPELTERWLMGEID